MLCVNFGFLFHFGGKSKFSSSECREKVVFTMLSREKIRLKVKFSAITKKWAEKEKNKRKVKVDSHIFTLRGANFSFFSFLFFRAFARGKYIIEGGYL